MKEEDPKKRRYSKTNFRSADSRRRLKQELFLEQGGKCKICDKSFSKEELTRDHIIPLVLTEFKDLDTKENQQLLCDDCHILKTKSDEIKYKIHDTI